MHIDRLTLAQWMSPAFPTGGFAYSHGLEEAVVAGDMRSAGEARDWIADVLAHGAGRSDALMLVAGLSPDTDPAALDDLARALSPCAERWEETLAQGTAFARTVAALTGRDLPSRALPLAVGQAAQGLALPGSEIAALYLHAFAANLVTVAVRFCPLGQTEGQKALLALHPTIATLATEAASLAAGLDAEALIPHITSGALGADMSAMRHETMDVRIYRT